MAHEFTVKNGLKVEGAISASSTITGTTFNGTASWASNANTASVLLGSAQTASYISSSATFDSQVYNLTASNAGTASILLGSIQSASNAATASTLLNASASINSYGVTNIYDGNVYFGNALTHSGFTFKSRISATSYATNEVELADTYLTFMPSGTVPSAGSERRIYADENGFFVFNSLDGYPVSFINALSYSFDGKVVAPSFVGNLSGSASQALTASVLLGSVQTASYISSSATFDVGKVYNLTASNAGTASVLLGSVQTASYFYSVSGSAAWKIFVEPTFGDLVFDYS